MITNADTIELQQYFNNLLNHIETLETRVFYLESIIDKYETSLKLLESIEKKLNSL